MTLSDGNALRLSRRTVLGGLAGLMLPGGLLPGVASAAAEEPFEPPLMTTGYVHDRQRFQTRLLQKGPAPDKYEPLITPENAERLIYEGSELQLVAWVSRYKRTKTRAPAVLFLHGGNAIGQGHWKQMTPYIEAGYVVMMPSLRGENGQRGNFSGFYDEITDVLEAGKRLAHLPGVDPDRIFLAGHSIGGTMALLAAMSTRRFKAATPISANPDAYAFFKRYPEDIRFDTSDEREFQLRSPVCYPHSFKCPLKLMHGVEETRLVTRLGLLSARTRAAGKHMEIEVVPGGHETALPGEIQRSVQFFKSVAA